jgi:cytochrome c biogenesis protein
VGEREDDAHSGPSPAGIVNWTWRFFSSIKLAVILILVVGACSLLGALFPSLDVFRSWWFLFAGLLLMLNIFVCTLNRWPGIESSINGGEVIQQAGYYTAAKSQHVELTSPSSPREVAEAGCEILRGQRYRVRIQDKGNDFHIAADRNRYSRLGTVASHFSLILFVLAYLLGSYLGFRDTNFVLAEGSIRPIGHGTVLSLQLVSFVDEYYPDGTPKDYRSDVIMFYKGQEAARSLVRVNHPLEFEGIRVYQSFYGPAVQIKASKGGVVLFEGSVALNTEVRSQDEVRSVGEVTLPVTGTIVHLVGPAANVVDPLIPAGHIAIDAGQKGATFGADLLQKGAPLEIQGIEYIYLSDTKFSGFQITKDPANWLVWLAAALFVMGNMAVFYFPYRQFRVLVYLKGKESRLVIRPASAGAFAASAEMQKLVRLMKQRFKPGEG